MKNIDQKCLQSKIILSNNEKIGILLNDKLTKKGKWIIGQKLDITINFNTTLKVTQPGTPSIDLTFDNRTVTVPYFSGDGQNALIFRYIIEEGDVDADGNVGISSINLNGGTITDMVNTNIIVNLPTAASAPGV